LIFSCISKNIKGHFSDFFRRTLKLKISTHDFRTTKITNLLTDDKLGIEVVQKYAGHEDPATTLGYAKVKKEQALAAIKNTCLGKRKMDFNNVSHLKEE